MIQLEFPVTLYLYVRLDTCQGEGQERGGGGANGTIDHIDAPEKIHAKKNSEKNGLSDASCPGLVEVEFRRCLHA